jgi:3',5'-cyclic AMP phosphodiesterase CpdA
MFLLAQLSDVHLAPLPRPGVAELSGKRLSGYLSWRYNRRTMHSRKIINLMTRDIIDIKPDHVALTGDLVNIATRAEFSQSHSWLSDFGPDDWISIVPGNHDAYVPVAHAKGIGLWQSYMTSNVENKHHTRCFAGEFPYVRRFDDIVLIGLSSAIPTLPFVAGGRIGADQLEALAKILEAFDQQNLCRIIMIHHPPLPGQNAQRKALWDATAFKNILQRHGAELVLHGHNHTHMFTTTPGPDTEIPVYGVPSASMRHGKAKPAAHYYLFNIEKTREKWSIRGTMRGLKQDETGFEDCGPLPRI